MILIYKKGSGHIINNYRPISLAPVVAKIFSKVLEARMRSILNEQQPREQAGFRKGFSTIDHLQVINQLIEKSNEYQIKTHLLLIDYTKAFDTISHPYLIKSLLNQGVPKTLVKIIMDIYENIEARIITDKEGRYFKVKRGVRQGDPMSSALFNCLLEEIFRTLEWNDKGINTNGEKISNLRFADDVILMEERIEKLREMFNELTIESSEAGLEANIEKTKVLSNELKGEEVDLGSIKIQNVTEAIYLGQLISYEEKTKKEVNRRVNIAWAKFWGLKHIFKGSYSNKLKSDIFNSCIIPSLTYASQTWALTKRCGEIENYTKQNGVLNTKIKVKR